MKKPLVIIGSGHAGHTLARAFRQHDTSTPVVVLTEDGGEYDPKPQFGSRLLERLVPEPVSLHLHSAMHQVTLRFNTVVARIDTLAKGDSRRGETHGRRMHPSSGIRLA